MTLSTPNLTLHHLNRSRSTRVLWLLEELEVPYDIVRYDRDPKTLLAPAALRRIHPLGKSPVLVDGDTVVAESAVILEHVLERYGAGRLQPAAGTPEARAYRYFMHYAEGSLMPQLLLKFVFARVRSAPMPFFMKPVARLIADSVSARVTDPNLAAHLAFLNDALTISPWCAGPSFTAADIQMSYPMQSLVARGAHLDVPARIVEYVSRLQARPAYQRAVQKGGPVELA